MPLDYGQSNQLRDAIATMRSRVNETKVGLVIRFNRLNYLVWTIYSETLNQPDLHNISPNARYQFDRRDGDAREELEVFTPPNAPVSQIGCHAEEILIVNWNIFVREARARYQAYMEGIAEPAPWSGIQLPHLTITEVDIILSKSPCNGPGASQPLRYGGRTYGTGCAMKLWKFCALPVFANVSWRIFYCALPPEKTISRYPEPALMPPGLTNKEKKQWNQSRANRTAAADNNLTSRRTPQNFGHPAHLTHSHVGKLVRLSLMGIGRLNSMPNVSCEPLID